MCNENDNHPNKKKKLQPSELPDDIRQTTRGTINKEIDSSILKAITEDIKVNDSLDSQDLDQNATFVNKKQLPSILPNTNRFKGL